jgi:hypothetical protein
MKDRSRRATVWTATAMVAIGCVVLGLPVGSWGAEQPAAARRLVASAGSFPQLAGIHRELLALTSQLEGTTAELNRLRGAKVPAGDLRYGAVAKQLGAQRGKLAELQRQVSSAPKLDEQQALRTLQASKPPGVRTKQEQDAALEELKKKYEEAKEDFKKALKILSDHLEQQSQVAQKLFS